jgi:hypothetical protein
MINLHCKNLQVPMSALGQKRTFFEVCAMSALPPKADIAGRQFNVRFVPKADICLAILSALADEAIKTSSGLW